MFVDFEFPPTAARKECATPARPEWTVLVPFFNEAAGIVATLESLAAQTAPLRVVLIDNGSTDGSGVIARAACQRLRLGHLLVVERRPGKVAALEAGLARVDTAYVATCDADTWYPPHYLSAAGRVLARGNAIAGAFFVPEAADARTRRREARRIAATAALLRGQCHTGGAGQAFRTEALRRAGGFDPRRWGFVLEDHEVIHRVLRHGAMRYARDLWCSPAPRPRDRASIRWTVGERLLYCVAAPVAGDWFFYHFLASRLSARRLTSERIRERPFQDVGRVAGAHSLCG